jgi:ABC-type nitrate/sulfonate/bicarbonate transport system permease component
MMDLSRGALDSILILSSLIQSLVPLLLGYCLAVLVGCVVGVLVGWNKIAYEILKRVLQIPAALPAIALIPTAITLTQSNQQIIIPLVIHSAVWWIAIYTATAVQVWQQQRRPTAAIASLSTGLRFGMAMAWVTVIVIELVTAGGRGIGFLLWDGYNNADQSQVLNATVAIGVVGFLLDQAIDLVSLLISWLISKRKPDEI